MTYVGAYLYSEQGDFGQYLKGAFWAEKFGGGNNTAGVWDVDANSVRHKLNHSRLQDQMFANTVTNQVINTFNEIGLPFILRRFDSFRATKANNRNGGKKKRVVFEDEVPAEGENGEKAGNGKEEREFLEMVRQQVALPPYHLFVDYSEMVTQFGYVALWSTIWPLAPGLFSVWLLLRLC
jgi:anoctamin-10